MKMVPVALDNVEKYKLAMLSHADVISGCSGDTPSTVHGLTTRLIIAKCRKCKQVHYIDKFESCGCSSWQWQHGILVCKHNKVSETYWSCSRCSSRNEYSDSLYYSSKLGCFIATACYDSYSAPEVLILRQFRDNILLKSIIGRAFVTFYYAVSPRLADFIAARDGLKKLVRSILVAPAVKWAELWMGKCR